MLLSEHVISVTDLRKDLWSILKQLNTVPKYIFASSKPIAVLLSPEEYERLLKAAAESGNTEKDMV